MKSTISLSSPTWTVSDLRDLASEAFQADDDARAALVAAELRQRGEEVEAEDIERNLALRETAEALRAEGEWAHGGNVAGTAREWFEAGFAPEEVRKWLSARTFRADAAADLRDLGITPEQASAEIEVELGGYRVAVGYAVSNGDMLPANALRAIRGL